jgi:hypothetical protein
LSFRPRAWSTFNPAAAADWYRALLELGLHPFQDS